MTAREDGDRVVDEATPRGDTRPHARAARLLQEARGPFGSRLVSESPWEIQRRCRMGGIVEVWRPVSLGSDLFVLVEERHAP